MINKVRAITANLNHPDNPTMLPVIFINREGEAETPGLSAPPACFDADTLWFRDAPGEPKLDAIAQPETVALNRLRRALFETGQLIVTPRDGLSRVCFAGIGAPSHVFVEAVPRDVAVPVLDHDFPGRVCSLAQAEEILRRLYRGETSDALSASLSQPVPDESLQAA